MAARSTICALLFAIPVLVVALVGFSSGLGGLPFGINSLASGPTDDVLTLRGGGAQAATAARLVGSASTAAPAPAGSAADGTAGAAPGGGAPATAPGGGGGGVPGATSLQAPTTPSAPVTTSPPIDLGGGGGSGDGSGNAANQGLPLPGGVGDVVDDTAQGAQDAVGGLVGGGGN